ncbi:MAG: leucine-rich repeat domain-containing protein [Verrucomicrobiae bacterium]|nr:leucine-rich repeat domain-containing protein [Verrucomicrobiae bacterium]
MPVVVRNGGLGAFRGISWISCSIERERDAASERRPASSDTNAHSRGPGWPTHFAGPADVAIPDTIAGLPVTAIGVRAFSNREDLTRVTIPHGVTTLENQAFARCFRLTGVTIPNTVTNLGALAFEGCGSLSFGRVRAPLSILEPGPRVGGQPSKNVPRHDG